MTGGVELSSTEKRQAEKELSSGEGVRLKVLFGAACELWRHLSGDVRKSVLYLGLEFHAGDMYFM